MARKIVSPNYANALASHQKDLGDPSKFEPFMRSSAAFYSDVEPGLSVRPEHSRKNYEYFRPGERIPIAKTQDDYQLIMRMCRDAYDRVGVIRSVIDMMSELGAEGIEIIHENENIQKFWNAWSKRVKLEDRAERFLSWLYKSGNVVVRRKVGKINSPEVEELKKKRISPGSTPGEIPLEYVFYDPSSVDLVGDYVGALSSNKIYAFKVPITALRQTYNNVNDPMEKKVYEGLPEEIKNALSMNNHKGSIAFPLPEDKIFVGSYKKDDSEIWGKSFIYSILADVFYNDKLKMAKTGGLDSFYNAIRIWKLGDLSLDRPYLPSPEEAEKIVHALEQHSGGGGIDIIWNSAIELSEHYPPVDKLVNFTENIDGILIGLGVPDSLVGGRSDKSASINYLGLKNVIKRLEAGRRLIREWLEKEIDVIQKNMGFRTRPFIRFSQDDLHDERTYFNILLGLVDRNVLSDTTILERINEIPEIEKARIAKQEAERKDNTLPEKQGPFQPRDVPPEETKTKEKPPGRPDGAKDGVKRVRRVDIQKPSSKAKMLLEANRLYGEIETFVLAEQQIKDVRSLTSEQKVEMENLVTGILAISPPGTKNYSMSKVADMFENNNSASWTDEFNNVFVELLKQIGSEKLTSAERKLLKAQAYAEIWT